MDAAHFAALTRHVATRLSRRHSLGLLGAFGLRGLLVPQAAPAKKKKKPCPPCKKRKKGKCKGTLPDGTPCAGGICQGGTCRAAATSPPVDPCPDQCCRHDDCPAGTLCCNGACNAALLAAGETCLDDVFCCSDHCRIGVLPNDGACAATCRGKGCLQAEHCCPGAPCSPVAGSPFHRCGGCAMDGESCEEDADCCYSACTAKPGEAQKVCSSYPGGPCGDSIDCRSCRFDAKCTVPLGGQQRRVCRLGICRCTYSCCADSDCEDFERCDFDANGLNGECVPIVGG